MGNGESSMPSWLSFKEESLCQKPSSTELSIAINWSKDSFFFGSAMAMIQIQIADLSLVLRFDSTKFQTNWEFFCQEGRISPTRVSKTNLKNWLICFLCLLQIY